MCYKLYFDAYPVKTWLLLSLGFPWEKGREWNWNTWIWKIIDCWKSLGVAFPEVAEQNTSNLEKEVAKTYEKFEQKDIITAP